MNDNDPSSKSLNDIRSDAGYGCRVSDSSESWGVVLPTSNLSSSNTITLNLIIGFKNTEDL